MTSEITIGKTRKPTWAAPFTIVIDTREQRPFRFLSLPAGKSRGGGTIAVKTERKFLSSGDYSLLGLEKEVAIERKSKADLYTSLGQERKRFEREVQRLNEYNFAAIVIEADWASILHVSPFPSLLRPDVVQATILSWSTKYPHVHWFPCLHRRHAEWVTYKLLEFYWRSKEQSARKATCHGQ